MAVISTSSSAATAAAVFVLLGCFVGSAIAGVLLSSLKPTLIVDATPKKDQELMAGVDSLTVTWRLQKGSEDINYQTVKTKLCYAKVSQQNRGWRHTKDDLKTDKTCQFVVASKKYNSSESRDGKGQSANYKITKEIPTATYFIRAYALDASGTEVAYGQTTDDKQSKNLFMIKGISGRHVSLDIAASVFSVVSVLALVGFFIAENRKKTV